ncbi:hypothetical protein RCH10_001362 [Variovorax sp. GrIS 2.14]
MIPLLFGQPSRQLFGLYHTPEKSSDLAVLICPPFGQEAIRTHRFFRVLSDRLARSGAAVLRFDLYGSGDSGGADLDGDFEGWWRDICTAHDELQRHAVGRRVVWLGSRMGATLAAMADRSGLCDPERIILWDPIFDGARYMESLRLAHVEALERSYFMPDRAWRKRLENEAEAYTDEVLGVAISPQLRQQFRSLVPGAVKAPTHRTVMLADPDDHTANKWAQSAIANHAPLRMASFRHSLDWTTDPNAENPVVPGEAVQRLLAEIDE